jgi:hypothetical protein
MTKEIVFTNGQLLGAAPLYGSVEDWQYATAELPAYLIAINLAEPYGLEDDIVLALFNEDRVTLVYPDPTTGLTTERVRIIDAEVFILGTDDILVLTAMMSPEQFKNSAIPPFDNNASY